MFTPAESERRRRAMKHARAQARKIAKRFALTDDQAEYIAIGIFDILDWQRGQDLVARLETRRFKAILKEAASHEKMDTETLR